jgi:hypothetical protein
MLYMKETKYVRKKKDLIRTAMENQGELFFACVKRTIKKEL